MRFDLTGPTGGASYRPRSATDFLAGYKRYRKRMGAETDPLVARSGTSIHGALADALKTNTRQGSARKGQSYLPVKVGNTRYHVYFDPKGKRTVIRAGGRRTVSPDTIGTGL